MRQEYCRATDTSTTQVAKAHVSTDTSTTKFTGLAVQGMFTAHALQTKMAVAVVGRFGRAALGT